MEFPVHRLGSIRDETASLHWTGEQLEREIAARAARLSAMRVGPGSRVALVHGGTARFLADLLAVWCRGAAASCLDPSLTGHERATVLSFLAPDAVLCGHAARPAPGEAHIACLEDAAKGPGTHDLERRAAAPGAPALILFTSGTTGSPKGVVLSFAAIAARLTLNIREIGPRALSRTLLTLPMHFGHGLIGNALTALWAGGELVIPPAEGLLARDLGAVARDHGISFLTSVPAFWRMAMKFADASGAAALRRVHVGSAPLAASLWSEIADWTGADVVNCYGMTETAGWIAGASSRDRGPEDGLVGKPWGGTAAVRSPAGAISSAGEGEIVVRSPSAMTGYLDDAPATRRALQDCWLRTGDIGLVSEDGTIRLSGRLKDEISRAGFKVQPAEIEALLEANPSVERACVFSLPDPASGEIVAVAVTLKPGTAETASSLGGWCLERARRELVPERWFFVNEIPASARGKTDRDTVRRMCLDQETASR